VPLSLRAMLKRGLDLFVAAAALMLSAPLLALVALCIRLDSPGPVLFRQERVGLGGQVFRIRKFRTMVIDAPARGPGITVGADPRVTRVGRVLRRSKLDELPQLLDVLAGHMSLVGPRPELPGYVALYPPELRALVLGVRPGITDPASLKYADEATLLAAAADPEREYREVLLPAKLRESADYIRGATLASDLWVLARTAALLLGRRGG
jgi:lipopolysaccharide/colanic/teichoic acid biosynthesis glycosyltransferase